MTKKKRKNISTPTPLKNWASFLAEAPEDYMDDWFREYEKALNYLPLSQKMGGSVLEHMLRLFENEARTVLQKHDYGDVHGAAEAQDIHKERELFHNFNAQINGACKVLIHANLLRGNLKDNNSEEVAMNMFLLCVALLRGGGIEGIIDNGYQLIKNRHKTKKEALMGIIYAVHYVLNKHGDNISTNQIWKKIQSEELKFHESDKKEELYEIYIEEDEDRIYQNKIKISSGNTKTKGISKSSFKRYVTEIKKVRKNQKNKS